MPAKSRVRRHRLAAASSPSQAEHQHLATGRYWYLLSWHPVWILISVRRRQSWDMLVVTTTLLISFFRWNNNWLINLYVSQWRNRQGAECLQRLLSGKFLLTYQEERGKGKRVKIEKKRRKIVKGKVEKLQNEERVLFFCFVLFCFVFVLFCFGFFFFFFCFAFYFSKPQNKHILYSQLYMLKDTLWIALLSLLFHSSGAAYGIWSRYRFADFTRLKRVLSYICRCMCCHT